MPNQKSVENMFSSGLQHWPQAYKNVSPAILRLHRVHKYLTDEFEALVSQHQLQRADFGILSALRRSAPPYCLSPTDLYHSMLFSSGGLTKVLNRVTDAGLVERVENPEDGRSKLVRLTDAGKDLIEKAMSEVHDLEKEQLSVLSPQELDSLEQLLHKLICRWE
ncbi:MarR family winged helix-turn-helix transcriptional regulator [Vibrio sp.]|uniref:MarR family winged helix-turn-helix transcriptional regulator n=1 Tax=Vibrio sp. TaxID=678 RepID=UPI003D0FBF98